MSAHTFHIPVMGIGFTVDTPLKVAKYGISSVISLVDDILLEQMREYHCRREGIPFEPIPETDPDPRARRITAYLNLIDHLVARDVRALQSSPFAPGSEITRYFALIPDSPPKALYRRMLNCGDPVRQRQMQDELRNLAVPGRIDINIMVALDCAVYRDGEKLPVEQNDAMSAMRGFAQSSLESAVVLSAGVNPHLYGYISHFSDFLPDARGRLRKQVILKVSDFRSAEVQGKLLAKRGVWVSEFRIESGLNCGGHSFPTKGQLTGPVLAEFREKRAALRDALNGIYQQALAAHGHTVPPAAFDFRVTVQGGIGTAAEDLLLRTHYGADATGWATPFLLVPEVVNVDDELLRLLSKATPAEVFLSDSSPVGVPYWNLRTSPSEKARERRIREGNPGSPCRKHFLAFSDELTPIPICTASRQYQRLKLDHLVKEGLSGESLAEARRKVLLKSCICHDLGGCATLKLGIDPSATPAVCCGPNMAYFSQIATLDQMVDHIYGRKSLPIGAGRPNIFIQELALYVEYAQRQFAGHGVPAGSRQAKYFSDYLANLLAGIAHYRQSSAVVALGEEERFLRELDRYEAEIRALAVGVSV